MNLKVILAIDPSGSFKEGKGTTGFAIMKKDSKGRIKILDHFIVQAAHYNRRSAYWEAVLYEIKCFMQKYRNGGLVIENFRLYATHAKAQVNHEMETCRLLGIIEMYCIEHEVPYYFQMANQVKARWSDEVLVHKNILTKYKNAFYVDDYLVNEHARDAIRHGVHYLTFNKGACITNG